jgi:hypothetical protein
MNKNIRILAIFVLVLVLAGATYAFAAANTVPASKAGDGSGGITGYTVSAIHYTLNTTNPANIDSVTFTLNTAPTAGSTIRIQLNGAWYTCTFSGTAVTCNNGSTLGVPVNAITTLEVVVAD